MAEASVDTDVIVIGSGFGGAVAALRFSELGERVTVLERGDWVTRERFATDLDFFWLPERDCFGMNDIQKRGANILPWVGAAVGGGSHVYAGTMKRSDTFHGYPAAIVEDDMGRWYDQAEQLMLPVTYPTYAPYHDNNALHLLRDAANKLAVDDPELIADRGLVKLAISFAPEGADVDADFTNVHGAQQRYHHPHEQSILGGDIDAKNTLDKNYLHLATAKGAEIRPLVQVDRVEQTAAGTWRVEYRRWVRETSSGRRWIRRWIPGRRPKFEYGEMTARRLVVSAGSIGSAELLLRARNIDCTLPELSPALGERYTTNGDAVSLLVPTRGTLLGWIGFALMVVGLIAWTGWFAAVGAAAYFGQLVLTPRRDADLGTTNSDYIRFAAKPGISDCMYVEGGRYPTPGRLILSIALGWMGRYRPARYRAIVLISRVISFVVPPLALIDRMWPIPLLKMGRDHAVGRIRLHPKMGIRIDYDPAPNRAYYAHLDELGKKVAKAAGAVWMPNFMHRMTGVLEVPHNQGGVPMGESAEQGVVDHAGRVFGYDNLMVLDGSIIPVSPGPNPAFTILAISERAMSVIAEQVRDSGTVSATPRRMEVRDSA